MKFLKKIARWIKSLYRRGKDMSFGLQTFDEKGGLAFNSEDGELMRVLNIFTIGWSTTVYPSEPGPYKVLVQRFASTSANSGYFAPLVSTAQGSNYVTLSYRYQYPSSPRNEPLPCRVVILK